MLGHNGEPVPLSSTEFELLAYLVHHRGHAVSRDRFLRAVWGDDHDPGTTIVDVYSATCAASCHGEHGAPSVTIRSVGSRLDASD